LLVAMAALVTLELVLLVVAVVVQEQQVGMGLMDYPAVMLMVALVVQE
jgi:hypothetical protein